MPRMLAVATFVGLLAGATCAHAPTPPPVVWNALAFPDNAMPFHDKSGLHARWWRETEACAGHKAEFARVAFYLAFNDPRHGFGDSGGYATVGLAYPQLHAIVLDSRYVFDPDLVRHEMLHLIASPGRHDPEFYKRRCAALVYCVGACEREE